MATAARETRNRLAKGSVAAEKAERRERGPKVGQNIYYNEYKNVLYCDCFSLWEKTIRTEKYLRRNFEAEIQKNGSIRKSYN